LDKSDYILFIISKAFLQSPWTQSELYATLHTQISNGTKKALPILMDDLSPKDLPPLLRHLKYLEWSGVDGVVGEVGKVIAT